MNTTVKKGLSGFGLKYIALLTMTIDHAGLIFLNYGTLSYTIARSIGRIAFPIFCFLLVEGFFHTSNRRSYFTRLLLFAFLSEIPFDMAVYYFPYTTELSVLNGHQNVFFTLALGFLALYVIDNYKASGAHKSLASLAIGVLFGCVAEFLKTDYSYIGIMVILLFYLYRINYAAETNPVLGCILPLIPLLAYGDYFIFLAVPFLYLYDGRKGSALPGGRSYPGAKYLFYIYYPLHLLVFSSIHLFLL